MKFIKVRFKNILSFGNEWTEIDLNTNETILISGTNGSGKSAILEPIYFAFTGKSYRNITKAKLVNTFNKKKLLVELSVEHGGSEYLIRRGISPNIFEVEKDGSIIDEDAHIKDYQKQLEMIFGLDGKTFKQTIMLSSRYYIPFLDLKPQEKRDFIENIFSLKLFSDMNDYLKKKLQVTKLNVKGLEKDIEHVLSNIKVLEDLNDKQINQNNEQKEVLLTDIKTLENNTTDVQSSIVSKSEMLIQLNEKLKKVQKKLEKKHDITKAISLIKYKISEHINTVKFFQENHVCEKCGQNIDELFKTNIIEEENNKKDVKEEKLEKLNDALDYINKFNKKSIEIIDATTKITQKVINLNSEIRLNTSKINDKKRLINELNDVTIINQKDFDVLKENLEKYENEKNELVNLQKYVAVAVELISEKGIKKYIIGKYIPILNNYLNQYLQKFEAPYSVMFDNELNETIIARGYENLGYLNLSSGEKQRLDIALVFSFLKLCQLKNSINTNAIFVDEILDQSLDQTGIDSILRIFDALKAEGYTIFVVSHREGISEHFDKNIIVSKKKFSEIKYVGKY